MPGSVRWFIPCLVNITAYDAVQVAPSDDKSQGDSPFVNAFSVIGYPSDGISNTWVDSHSAKECSGVLDSRRRSRKQHGKANDSKQRDNNIAETTLAGAIGDEAKRDGENSSGCIRGNGKELSFSGLISELE